MDGKAGQSFKYVVRRMSDLTQENDGIRGNEVEKQLRDRVLEACFE